MQAPQVKILATNGSKVETCSLPSTKKTKIIKQ